MANAGWLDRMLGKDPDEVFSYTTKKHVIISDKMIAILSLFMKSAVFVYIIFYVLCTQVFIVLRKFETRVQNIGYMYYRVEGKAFSRDAAGNRLAWDLGDIMFPEIDPTGPFIATRVFILRRQQIGQCGPDCTVDTDCPYNPPRQMGQCMPNGQCNEMRWCPDIENSRNVPIEEVRLQGIRDIRFYIYSGIKFEQVDSDYFINEDDNPLEPYDDDRAIVYTVGDILGEENVDVDGISRTGALMNVEFWFSCNGGDSDCAPTIKYDRMDPESRSAPTISK